MEEQEYYRFKIKALRSFFTPRKYEVFDAVTQELKYTCHFKGKAKFRCFLYDLKGEVILEAQKQKWMKTNLNYTIFKNEEEIAKFGRHNLTFPQRGTELITKSQTYKGFKGKYTDDEGKEVFSIEAKGITLKLSARELFVDVDLNFDINLAIIVSLILYFYMFEN